MANRHIIPFEATHPGVLIKDELEIRNDLNQKDLAKELGVKPSFLNEIIKGKRPVTADVAILLEKSLDIPADYWMKFQSQFEIDRARIKEKNIIKLKNIELWSIIKKYVPIKYFKKLGYLSDSLEDDMVQIKSIYFVKTVEELVDKFSKNKFSYYRKSEKLKIDEKNMLAWSVLAQYEAKKQIVNNYRKENINQLCLELKNIFYRNENTKEETKKILNQYGIKFVSISSLEKTPVDGYSFWSENSPAIALSFRYKRLDNFAFTLMHEIGHVSLHLEKEKEFIDFNKNDEKDLLEQEADLFARKKLIPENVWKELPQNSFPSDDEIISFGKKHHINPAIILGRICYEKNQYARKTKIDKRIK